MTTPESSMWASWEKGTDMDGHFIAVTVDPGDPRNDQAIAEAAADLDWHVKNWARTALDRDNFGPTETAVAMYGAFMEHPEEFPPARLAALLSVALTRLAATKVEEIPGVETFEEWRVTGDPGGGYLPYSFTRSSERGHEDPEGSARIFIEKTAEHGRWPDGPYLHRRTVTRTPWEKMT